MLRIHDKRPVTEYIYGIVILAMLLMSAFAFSRARAALRNSKDIVEDVQGTEYPILAALDKNSHYEYDKHPMAGSSFRLTSLHEPSGCALTFGLNNNHSIITLTKMLSCTIETKAAYYEPLES